MSTKRCRTQLFQIFSLSMSLSLALSASDIPTHAAVESGKQSTASPQAKTESADLSFDDLQSKAFMLVMDGKQEESADLLNSALKSEKDKSKRTSLIYMLAAVERMHENYSDAVNHLLTVMKAKTEAGTKMTGLEQCLLLKRIGDCYWGKRDSKNAISNYSAALQAAAALPAEHSFNVSVLEAITGTYVYDKNYTEAENFGKKLLALTELRAKSNKLEDIAALFWARVQLLSIYRSQGKESEGKQLRAETTEMLDKVLTLRAELESQDKLPEMERVKQDFEQAYINQYKPQTPAEYLWLASEFKMKSLPLINWPAKSKSAKAALLCVHGLGLENRSFAPFGHAMQERGYSVYAMDVRGFGSWLTTQGQEDLHFQEAIKDIGAMISIIKQREPNIPIFLLGESMGGAIALRGAAAYGENLAGVISSVPSAELFQMRRMGTTVAFHLLHGGANKPFRVGDMVTEQATANSALADQWKRDYKAKMEMSPKELIKFAVFMRRTKGECEKIKIPTFVVQGLKDKLVKPQGTFELFEAVSNEDKNLFILGTMEHLIFETFNPSKLLMDALTTWIDEHGQKRAPGQKSE